MNRFTIKEMNKRIKSITKTSLFLIVFALIFTIITDIPDIARGLMSVKEDTQLEKCVDGDTAWFMIDGESTKVRFLFVDTPESTNTIEPQGKEASNFTCNMLSNAESISLEYDGTYTDKYGRTLAWVWVDGKLLQEELARSGYVSKYYDYGNYKYEDRVRNAQTDPYFIFENE